MIHKLWYYRLGITGKYILHCEPLHQNFINQIKYCNKGTRIESAKLNPKFFAIAYTALWHRDNRRVIYVR